MKKYISWWTMVAVASATAASWLFVELCGNKTATGAEIGNTLFGVFLLILISIMCIGVHIEERNLKQ